jgi:hypothetical protein
METGILQTDGASTLPVAPTRAAKPVTSAVVVGLALAVAQAAVAWQLGLVVGAPHGYLALRHWDGIYYELILTEGYHSPEPITPTDTGTAGYFPGYPAAAFVIRSLTGLGAPEALLVTAQLACWGFWTYVLLLCRGWGLSPRVTACVVLALALQPGSFFLVAAYSESLFLMATVGYFYWSARPGPKAAALAAAHGFVMTATRLVGLPLAAFPVVRALLLAPWGQESLWTVLRRQAGPLLTACVALLGAASFFVFCQFRLGHWDQYMRTQCAGMCVVTDAWGLLSGRVILECWPGTHEHWLHPNVLGRLCLIGLLLAFATAFTVEILCLRRSGSGWRERVPFYLCAAALLLIPAATSCRYVSMLRYGIPVTVVLGLMAGHLRGHRLLPRPPAWGRYLLCGAGVALLALQLCLLVRYLRGWWVA